MRLKRIVLLIGFFASNAVQLVIYSHDSSSLIAFRTLSLLAVVAGIIVLFNDAYLTPSLICDSFLFGLTVGWLIVVGFGNAQRYVEFVCINAFLLLCMLLIDLVSQCQQRKQNGLQFATPPSPMNLAEDEIPRSFSLDDVESKAIDDSCLYGVYRVHVDRLPGVSRNISSTLLWSEFSFVEHRIDSSSCHIYSAMWKDSPVILKLIKADRMKSAQAIGEFEMEANILSRVRHPNIINLLGSGSNPRPFLVLELLDGGTLSHSLGLRTDDNHQVNKQIFSYLDTLRFARALAGSLDYLHNTWHSGAHIIHRDLKPDNIGWTADGVLKLFDFGLASCVRKQVDCTETYALTGNTGTLRYMAPEVALGLPYNQSVDVFSFAVIVWQVLRGKVPFSNMGKKTFIDQVIVGGQRPLLDKAWPAKFKKLLEKCWHQDKDKRPTFQMVLKDLDKLIAKETKEEETGIRGCMSGLKKICWNIYKLVACARLPLLVCSIALAIFSAVSLAEYGLNAAALALAILSSGSIYSFGLSFVPGAKSGRRPVISFAGLGLGNGSAVLNFSFNPISGISTHGMRDTNSGVELGCEGRAAAGTGTSDSDSGRGPGATQGATPGATPRGQMNVRGTTKDSAKVASPGRASARSSGHGLGLASPGGTNKKHRNGGGCGIEGAPAGGAKDRVGGEIEGLFYGVNPNPRSVQSSPSAEERATASDGIELMERGEVEVEVDIHEAVERQLRRDRLSRFPLDEEQEEPEQDEVDTAPGGWRQV